MAYAGIFSILQMYKMQKSDSDFNLQSYLMRRTSAAEDSQVVNNFFDSERNKLNKEFKVANNPEAVNDAAYIAREMELEADFNEALAEVAGEEEFWQMKMDKEQTTNALLQKNVENFQKMLEANIASSHTYGYTK